MSDIIERLREFEHNWADKLDMADACQDAADEIERNRAAIAELVGALSELCTRIDIDGASPLDSSEYSDALAAITKHQQPAITGKD